MADLACRRPGCPGHYDQDGYCDECGTKAPASLLAAATAATAASVRPSMGQPSVPTAGLAAPSGAGLAGRTGTGTQSRSRSAGRGRLGANLVEVPPVPLRDPASAVQKDPKVPEAQRRNEI